MTRLTRRHFFRFRSLALAAAAFGGGCKEGSPTGSSGVAGYTMSLNPAALTVAPGARGAVAITLNRTASVEPVALSVTGLPSGVTATFAPPLVTGLNSTLTLDVVSIAEVGNYPLVVQSATSTGVQSRPLTLTISGSSGGGDNVVMVEAGTVHTCAVKSSGQAYCWGSNAFGQLGDGTTVDHSFPTLLSGIGIYAKIDAGGAHSCGITTVGAAFCWGNNGFGALGDGSGVDRSRPVAVSGGLQFSAIDATGSPGRTCGLTATGAGYCWGDNPHGEIGDGTIAVYFAPKLVSGGTFTSISTGQYTSCGIRAAGKAFCWGFNSYGQVGDGRAFEGLYEWTIPTAVSGALTFAQMSAGDVHTCGVTQAGAGYCWGDNTHGELGDGTITIRAVPTLVAGGRVFASISAGNAHTCGVATDGTAYCWGFNGTGQLGDGSTISRLVPTPVTGGLKFSSISVGDSHTCGVTVAGAVYCWGYNSSGQLGDGTTTNRLVPTAVLFQ